jgi:hypothetical protein
VNYLVKPGTTASVKYKNNGQEAAVWLKAPFDGHSLPSFACIFRFTLYSFPTSPIYVSFQRITVLDQFYFWINSISTKLPHILDSRSQLRFIMSQNLTNKIVSLIIFMVVIREVSIITFKKKYVVNEINVRC